MANYTTIAQLKKDANVIVRHQPGTPRPKALDLAAVLRGFRNYADARQRIAERERQEAAACPEVDGGFFPDSYLMDFDESGVDAGGPFVLAQDLAAALDLAPRHSVLLLQVRYQGVRRHLSLLNDDWQGYAYFQWSSERDSGNYVLNGPELHWISINPRDEINKMVSDAFPASQVIY